MHNNDINGTTEGSGIDAQQMPRNGRHASCLLEHQTAVILRTDVFSCHSDSNYLCIVCTLLYEYNVDSQTKITVFLS